jgi:quercetin dioxygenase-like cupin family protein
MVTQQTSYALTQDEGQALWFLGNVLTRVKATGDQTGGAYGLVDQILPAGFASPWHLHHAEDETFYVLAGEITFLCGDTRVVGGPGTFVYGPRGIPHGFRAGASAPARLLLMNTPAGFEQFVRALSAPASADAPPPAGPPDMEQLIAMAARYHIDILGPLPE